MWRQCAPHRACNWSHPNPHPKRHLDRFSRFCAQLTAESPNILHGPLLSPSKSPLCMGIWIPSSTWSLGTPLNGIWLGSAVFAGLTSVTDRQTDRHTTPSVTIRRIYVHSTATHQTVRGWTQLLSFECCLPSTDCILTTQWTHLACVSKVSK